VVFFGGGGGGGGQKLYYSEGSHAVPARPSIRGRLEAR